MIELAHTLLPNLPTQLYWVYGVFYIIETIAFFTILLAPFIFLFNISKNKRRF